VKLRKNPLHRLSQSQQDDLLADVAITGALFGASIEEKLFIATEVIPDLLKKMRESRSKTPPGRTDGPEATTQAD
jgi:hypothetical protein